jgi:hypothetical protein
MKSFDPFLYEASLKLNLYNLTKKTGDYSKYSICKNRPPYVFKKYLDQFTDVFIRKGYLDIENVKQMNDLFSLDRKYANHRIKWKKSYLSLLTFVFLADKLDFFDKSICPTRYNKYYEIVEVQYSALLLHHFSTVHMTELQHYKNSRDWKQIHNAIEE